MPLWWCVGADHVLGGYHEAIDFDGRPVALPRRSRVAARQAFCYWEAGRLGWNGPWRQAGRHALNFLQQRFRQEARLHVYRRCHRDRHPPCQVPATAKSSVVARRSRAGDKLSPWRLYNVGNSRSVEVIELVRLLEQTTGRSAVRELLPMQPGDVLETCADSSDLERAVGFRPNTSIEEGTRLFVEWSRAYRRAQVTKASA